MNIPAIAASAAATAFAAADSVLTACTIYLDPVNAYDPDTDSTTPTWGAVLAAKKALFFDDSTKQGEQENPAPESRQAGRSTRMALFQVADLEGRTINQHSEINDGEQTWKVSDVEKPPGNAIVIVSLMI